MIARRRFSLCEICGLVLALSIGCSERHSDKLNTGPGPQADALYGEPTGVSSQTMMRAVPSGPGDGAWTNAAFWSLQTELSPATLYHSSTKYLGFFTQMGDYGLGAPTFAAFSTRHGPRSFRSGAAMDPGEMEENWLLVWFHGARGWTNWDSPWAIFLQHRPVTMNLDPDGLHFTFGGSSGNVALMPLYGYDKLPLRTNDFLAAHGLPEKKIRTWLWSHALPREPLMRVRYWAGATREFPVYCEDSFSVDRSQDSVTIRQRFAWHSIDDDWKTKHVKLAPLSPPLAHASKEKEFPARFSRAPMDFDYFTPYGPYLGVEEADTFDTTFKVLQYVNETEAIDLPKTNLPPAAQRALDKLREAAGLRFNSPGADKPGIFLDHWARALPYCDERLRSNACSRLRNHLAGEVVDHSNEVRDTILESVWTYAHFSGDWGFVRERWPHLRQLFAAGGETRWVGFGRDGTAELGKQTAPDAAFARLAYKMGDMDSYNYACYLFARELVHHHLKQRGAEYFRSHQPWHSMGFMDEEVFLTSLSKETAGWQIDGPTYPADAVARQFSKRWSRFHDWDAARFYREHYRDDLRREFNWLANRREAAENTTALVQLRSLLLNEFSTPPANAGAPEPERGLLDDIASGLVALRNSHPTRFERLIPGGAPSPFVAGLEREERVPNVSLVQTVLHEIEDKLTGAATITWPQVTWPAWKTPTGASWNFGHVRPVRDGAPMGAVKVVPLNWNTRVVLYDLRFEAR